MAMNDPGHMDQLLEWLTEPSYFTRMGFHRPFLEKLLATLEEADVRVLRSLAFVLIKPDAIASGKAGRIVEFLSGHGLLPLHSGICFQAGPRHFEELYKFNLTLHNQQNMVGSWWLNSQVYVRGPVITLLVFDEARSGSVHARIAAIKGPANPYQCKPGQLRFDLGACNRSVNLIHTADDPLSSARELLIFHGAGRLAELLRRFRGMTAAEATAHGRQVLVETGQHLLGVETSPSTIDFPVVLARLKWRLWEVLGGGQAGQLAPLRPVLLEEIDAAGSAEDVIARTRRARAISRRELALVREAGLPAEGLGGAFRALADFDAYGIDVAGRVVAMLRAHGVPLSDWERLILETSMYYSDDFLHLEPDAPGRPGGGSAPGRP